MKMIDAVFSLTDRQVTELKNSHHDLSFDPRPALEKYGLETELGSRTFDAELMRREADLIKATGLQWPG